MKTTTSELAKSDISRKIYLGDFIILTAAFLILSSSVFLLHRLLYTEEVPTKNIIKIVTSPMEEEFCALVCEGDEIFDAITKRRVGVAESVSIEEADEGSVLVIEILAERNPNGHPLRTRKLWFEYSPYEE